MGGGSGGVGVGGSGGRDTKVNLQRHEIIPESSSRRTSTTSVTYICFDFFLFFFSSFFPLLLLVVSGLLFGPEGLSGTRAACRAHSLMAASVFLPAPFPGANKSGGGP